MKPCSLVDGNSRFIGTCCQWRTQEFCSGGGDSTNELRTEERENGDMGAVAP